MARRFEIKMMVMVIGATAVVMTIAMFSVFPVVAKQDIGIMTWGISYIVISVTLLSSGGARVHYRLKPVMRFLEYKERGEKSPPDVFEATRILALKYPVVGPISVAMFVTVGATGLCLFMIFKLHRPWQDLVFVLIVALIGVIFCVTFEFFIIKRGLRPILQMLFEENPSIWELPPPIRLSIRVKVLLSSLCMLAVMVLLILVMDTYFVRIITPYIHDPALMADITGTVWRATLMGILAAAVVGLVVGLLLSDDLGWPLQKITFSAESISRNELQEVIPWTCEDETGKLAEALNRMTQVLIANLRGEVERTENILNSLKDTVLTLARSSEAISDIAGRQSERASEQTTDAQGVSSASIEISAAARRISAHAQAVEEMSNRAKESSERGGDDLRAAVNGITTVAQRFKKVTEAIKNLGERSEEIRHIVELIREISSQINLLALNASLEAAGAGAIGRRFGVVATEVGRLAEKTSEAINQIHTIIEDVVEAIETSGSLASESGEAALASADVAQGLEDSFKRIFDLVNSTNQLAKEIGNATLQQTTASDLMVESVQGFADNAGLVESDSHKLADSVKELAEQADRLSILNTSKANG